jgi:nitrogen fixation protein NifU and related proteins
VNADLKALYTKIVKAHNDAPHHFEKRDDSRYHIKAYNPICGDRFELYLNHNSQRIDQAHFYGFGCAISKASTSVLTKSIEGKTIEDAITICNNFLQFINQEPVDRLTLTDEFRAFAGVHDFPERYDCATLSWVELKMYLERHTTQTERP